jgi:hypothetical protein
LSDLSALNPVELFELFFDPSVYAYLVHETNRYASASSDFRVSVNEMKAFIGIHLLSGYLDLPRWRMMWEAGTETYNPLVADAMRRDQFERIKANLHLADNDKLEESKCIVPQ